MARLDTPAVVIDRGAVQRNVDRMQAYCSRHGLGLWPHVKAHKMVEIAAMQLAAGADGLTCQTLGEAQTMADAGFDRMLIPTPIVGERKLERLVQLARRTTLTVGCDSSAGARAMSAALAQAALKVDVLVELDVGLDRTGVRDSEQAAALAAEVAGLDGLRLAGLLAHPTSLGVEKRLRAARTAIEAAGLTVDRVSGGGTMNAATSHRCPTLTELRVGVYVLGDRATIAAGCTSPGDVALTVRSTVVSRPTPTLAIIDAGSKTLTSDPANAPGLPGHGSILEYPEAVIARVSEEHGHIDLGSEARRPEIGDVVTVVPNHACGVMNLHDTVALRDGDGRVEMHAVQARGRTE